ncbi:MAG: ABC transporter permease [Bacteroidetes bacterium]|nr:ABC transporter permease [Bacteroidota bacterium]
MTFAGPLIIAAFYAAIALVITRDASDKEKKTVFISDESGVFNAALDSMGNYRFVQKKLEENEARKAVQNKSAHAVLLIRDLNLYKLDSVTWLSQKTLSIKQSEELRSTLSEIVYRKNLTQMGLRQSTIDSLRPKTRLQMLEIDQEGNAKSSSTGIKSGIGFGLALLIYLFIFLYGNMVMRSALEEKTNRIVEVIVSSVKPFQMMMGKILGVALVGLTQFTAWLILGGIAIAAIGSAVGMKGPAGMQQTMKTMPAQNTQEIQKIMEQSEGLDALFNLPYTQIIAVFLLFFLGGYLLYSSLFAAIGSAVNQETDVQQFIFPVSMPLVFGFVIAQTVVFQDPNGPMAKLFSYIPFTSPVVMMVRSPFGVSWAEIAISASILFLTFLFFVWITGRIYRVGILMYGKKPTWKELGKWIFMK